MATFTLSFVEHQGVEILSVVLRGKATYESLHGILVELEHVARERPSRRVLIDESDLDFAPMSAGDIRTLVGAWSRCPTLGESSIAVLAVRPLAYGINRMAQAFSERAEANMTVFRTRDAALAWLSAR